MKKSVKFLCCFLIVCNVAVATACNLGSGAEQQSSSFSEQEVTYLVTLSDCSVGGRVSFDKEEVKRGESVTITIEPEADYQIAKLLVNGSDVTIEIVNDQYTVSSVKKDIDVKAWFNKVNFQEQEENEILYVSESDAPILDGEIDTVWDKAKALYVSNIYDDNGTFTEEFSWVKVLWSENGLYFLGCIYDKTVVIADTCNFWVSESYVSAETPYSENAKDGNYAICMTSIGQNAYYTGVDIAEFWSKDSTAKITDFGYVVEVFVPCLSVDNFSEGREIGLDVSIDYYDLNNDSNSGYQRDCCVNWYGQGKYWSNVGALRKMTLVKE